MRTSRDGRSALLLPVAFLFYTALILTTFAMIFFARDRFRASASLIGWLAALPHLCYFAGCFLARPLYRIVLPRHSLMLATGLAAALILGMLRAGSLPLLFLLYGLFGFSLALFWPPLMGWLSIGTEGTSLNRILGAFNLCWSGGNVIAPGLAGRMLQRGPGVPFAAAALIMAVIFLSLLLVSRIARGIRADRRREPGQETGESDHSTPLRYPAWIGLCASYLILGITMSVLLLYLREDLGFSEARAGLLILFRALFSFFGFLLLGRLSFWHFRGGLMILGQLGIAAVVAAMFLLRSFAGLFLALALFGLLFSLSYDNSIFHGVSGSRRRSTRMAVHEGLLTAGMVAGSAGGGILYQGGGFQRVLLFGCAVVLILAAAQAVLLAFFRKSRAVPTL